MMWVLKRYEEVSGQYINKDKNLFYLHEETPPAMGMRSKKLTRIKKKLSLLNT